MAAPAEEEDNPTSLHWVIKSSNFGWQEINEHLKQGFYYVEEVDSKRRTPLFTAVENCSYEAVKALLQNKACVERVDSSGRTPLIVAMENKNCPISVLQVLLYYGSKINHRSCAGHSALDTCLRLNRGVEVVHLLLLFSAYVDPSHICIALQNGTSVNVLKALVSTRMALGACNIHGSQLHCLLASPKSRSREDLLEYRLQAGVRAYGSSVDGQYLICSALQSGAGLKIVKILMRAGLRLDGCNVHRSTVLCATLPFHQTSLDTERPEGYVGMPLKADIVQLLLDQGYEWNIIPVLSALRYCDYETKAIKLLLERANRSKPMDTVILRFCQETLSRRVFDHNVPPSIVKLLIEKGHLEPDKFDMRDGSKNTLLHRALYAKTCTPEMIKLLLKKGCSVDAKNSLSLTPLDVAIKYKKNAAILNLLLLAEARIGVGGSLKPLFLRRAIRRYRCRGSTDRQSVCEREEFLKTLFKFAFLEDPGFNPGHFISKRQVSPALLAFLKCCSAERRKMQVKVGEDGCDSLYDIVTQKKRRVQSYEMDMCLRSMLNNDFFPIYQEFILSKLDRKLLIDTLQYLRVYATKTCDGLELKYFLTYESLLAISKSLSTKDILSFVLAYYYSLPEDKDSNDVNQTIMFIANKIIANENNMITANEEARDSDLPTNPAKKPRLEIA